MLTAAVAGALPNVVLTSLLSPGAFLGASCAIVSAAAHASNTYYVNTTGDPGPSGTLSLRQAAALAAQFDTVTFDESLIGSTISLEQGAITIGKAFQISGFDGPRTVTIDGGNADRIFHVTGTGPGNFFAVYKLRLTRGHSVGCGGAIYAKNSALYLSNVRVSDSSAHFGGGVCAVGASAFLTIRNNSRISSNTAALGGGVYLGNVDAFNVFKSSISGNSATRAGGGLYVAGVAGYSGFSRALIAGNSVPAPAQYSYSSQGGGMVISGIAKSLTVAATTIAGNYSYGAGSAIRVLDAGSANNTVLTNVTVAANVTAGSGAVSVGAGTVTIESSIVANNPGGDLAGNFTANYSLVRNIGGAQITGSSNLLGADPLLGPLADHGGNTFCMLPDAASPAIDAANPGYIQTDQRFYPVVGVRDIGAVERQNPEDIIFRDGIENP